MIHPECTHDVMTVVNDNGWIKEQILLTRMLEFQEGIESPTSLTPVALTIEVQEILMQKNLVSAIQLTSLMIRASGCHYGGHKFDSNEKEGVGVEKLRDTPRPNNSFRNVDNQE